MMDQSAGTLYVVGTPIGNLEDITLRALRILKSADLIACEDTRHTKKLLNHYNIPTRAESYHKFNERSKCARFIDLLKSGKDIALVSDSGMPGISDPGSILIKEAITNNINVVPIPGPSAVITALVVSGLDTDRFMFEGFLPAKEMARNKRLAELEDAVLPTVFYESPRRVAETLGSILKIMGDRDIAVVRELTKIYEETIRGKTSAVLEKIAKAALKGEVVIIVERKTPGNREEINIKEAVIEAMEKLNMSKKEAIIFVAKRHNIGKKEVYKQAIAQNGG